MKKLVLLLVLVYTLSASCALPLIHRLAGAPLPPPPMMMVSQRGGWDCGIAVVAMLTGQTYEQVDAKAAELEISIDVSQGMYIWEMRKLARALGVETTPMPNMPTDLSTADGVIHVVWVMTGVHHFVYIRGGWIYDPLEKMPIPASVAGLGWRVEYFYRRNTREP